MNIYRIHLQSQLESSKGFKFVSSMTEAKKIAAEYRRDFKDEEPCPEIDVIEVKPTLKGIIDCLNKYAEHPDNG